MNDRKVNFVRNRVEIVEMMEKIYELLRNKKIDQATAIVVTDTLDWVLSDSDYLDQLLKDCEFNAETI